MKKITLTAVIITLSCLLTELSFHANAQTPCSVACSDAKKQCRTACHVITMNEKTRQSCINDCYNEHTKCQNDCNAVSGRFLRRDDDLMEEWLKSKFH